MVAVEAWECQSKFKWVEDLKNSLEKFGWPSGVVEKLKGVSLGEVRHMLKDCAWCEVRKAWTMESEERSKLVMVRI